MLVVNSLKIFFNNFKIALKVVFYKLVAFVLAASIIITFAYNSLTKLYSAGAFEQFGPALKHDSLQKIFIALRGAFKNFFEVLNTMSSATYGTFVAALVLFIVLAVFLINCDLLAENEVVYARASANCHISYSGVFFKKLGKSLLLSALNTVYMLVYFTASFFIIYGLSNMLDITGFFGIISPYLMILALLALTALYITVLGGHGPHCVAEDENIIKGLAGSIKLCIKSFLRVFCWALVLLVSLIVFNYMCASVFMGLLLLVSVPGSLLLINVFNLVCYMERTGSRYYTNPSTIISPKKREQFDKVKDLINLI